MLQKEASTNLRNKMTEKQYAPTKSEKKVSKKVETPRAKADSVKALIQKKEEKKEIIETKVEEKDTIKKSAEDTSKKVGEEAKDKVEEKKKEVKKVKKEQAVVNISSAPVSTKYSIAICKFIKNKKISDAIEDLEKVVMKKKPVPMKGEIPHRKGKIMSGRYPKRASEFFIKILKSLEANANAHEVENPVIVEAIPNIASRPYGKFGRVRRKRTHIKIVAKEKKEKKK